MTWGFFFWIITSFSFPHSGDLHYTYIADLAIYTLWWFRFLTTRDWNLFCYFCCCILHIKYFFLCVLVCISIIWLNVILFCLHMYFLWLNFSVLLSKVVTAAVLKHVLLHLGKRCTQIFALLKVKFCCSK